MMKTTLWTLSWTLPGTSWKLTEVLKNVDHPSRRCEMEHGTDMQNLLWMKGDNILRVLSTFCRYCKTKCQTSCERCFEEVEVILGIVSLEDICSQVERNKQQ